MGRKPKNKFIESLLAFDEKTTIRVFDIEMPFAYKFTVTPVGQTGYTEWECHIKQPADVPMVKDNLEKQGYNVANIEPSVRKMIDLCPKCHMRGIPKIEKKNTKIPMDMGNSLIICVYLGKIKLCSAKNGNEFQKSLR